MRVLAGSDKFPRQFSVLDANAETTERVNTMDEPKIETIARNLVIVAESMAIATRRLRENLEAFEETKLREAIAQIEEYEILDPFARLLEAMSEIRKQVLLEEFAVELEDIEAPKKTPRPPKRIGPVNKANYTANRPRRVARSCLCNMRR